MGYGSYECIRYAAEPQTMVSLLYPLARPAGNPLGFPSNQEQYASKSAVEEEPKSKFGMDYSDGIPCFECLDAWMLWMLE